MRRRWIELTARLAPPDPDRIGLMTSAPWPAIRRSLLAAAIVLALPSPAHGGGDVVERFTGTARGRDGALLYTELHEVQRAGGRLLSAVTSYVDPSGRRIASLQTDFATDPFAPPYVFEDLRRGVDESVARAPGGIVVRAGSRERWLPVAPDGHRQVVDGQGLDRLVRARLAELERGTSLELSYAIPSRLDAYDMTARAVDGPAGRVRVRVEFASWLLRLLAPSLEVEYDRTTRRLLQYRGPSNLTDGHGDNPDVVITYAYPAPGKPAAAAGGLHGSR